MKNEAKKESKIFVVRLFEYEYNETEGESLDYETNETAPGQETTIADLLRRFANGENVSGGRSIYYDGDEDVGEDHIDLTLNPDFDLSDYTSLTEAVKRKKGTPVSPPEKEAATEPLNEPSDDGEKTENA